MTSKTYCKEKTTILATVCKVTANKYKIFADGNYYVIPARGVMKLDAGGIKVGDKVVFDGAAIEKVVDRRSYFSRTGVANVTVINIVVSSVPKPDLGLVDKLIVEALSGGAKVAITVNKCDLGTEVYDILKKNYSAAVNGVFAVSALSGEGIDELKAFLSGEFCAFAGQSAVGKTSLINRIFSLDKTVGAVSEKTGRGRHTTTSREIHFDGDLSVVDTPGFSSIELTTVKSGDLDKYYKEFAPYIGKCYYIGCSHTAEPDCLIKDRVASGEINKARYDGYCEIYKEIKEYEKRKY